MSAARPDCSATVNMHCEDSWCSRKFSWRNCSIRDCHLPAQMEVRVAEV